MRFAVGLSLVLMLPTIAFAGQAEDAKAALDRHDYKKALKLLQPMADHGNPKAQFDVGLMYDQGWGVMQNYKEAMKWFRKSADQNDAHAQHRIAELYAFGDGVPQDYVEANKWDRMAAEHGYVSAQYSLGHRYYAGHGVQKDYAEAQKWWRQAADQGNQNAEYALGTMYQSGIGVIQDNAIAMKWYQKAADQGHARSEYALGRMYETGTYGRNTNDIGDLYAIEGTPVPTPPDYADAINWFLKAADQGNPSAQGELSQLYEKGLGVKQDYAEAYFWWRLVLSWGPIHDERYDSLAAHLSAKQQGEADRRVRDWLHNHASTPNQHSTK